MKQHSCDICRRLTREHLWPLEDGRAACSKECVCISFGHFRRKHEKFCRDCRGPAVRNNQGQAGKMGPRRRNGRVRRR